MRATIKQAAAYGLRPFVGPHISPPRRHATGMNPATALTQGKKRKTILIVDDEPSVIAMSVGCSTAIPLTFSQPVAAQTLFNSHGIRREITSSSDRLPMPRMSGIELETRMTSERPGLKVLG